VEAQGKEGIWVRDAGPGGFLYLSCRLHCGDQPRAVRFAGAESELVAGYMTEFSGFRWSLYFLAEYTNMIVVASVATTLFLGGWLRPFASVPWMNFLDFVPTLLMAAVGAYCVVRAPKQPTRVQQLFMLAVAGLCFVVGLLLVVPVIVPICETVLLPEFTAASGLFSK